MYNFAELEQENLMAGEKLVQTYEQAEELLNQVRQALRTISFISVIFHFFLTVFPWYVTNIRELHNKDK